MRRALELIVEGIPEQMGQNPLGKCRADRRRHRFTEGHDCLSHRPATDRRSSGAHFDREKIRQTVIKSTPQFGLMAELLFNTPGFRKHSKGIFYKDGFVAVLFAVAVDAHFRGQLSQAAVWSVLKL